MVTKIRKPLNILIPIESKWGSKFIDYDGKVFIIEKCSTYKGRGNYAEYQYKWKEQYGDIKGVFNPDYDAVDDQFVWK